MHKAHFFRGSDKLDMLQNEIFAQLEQFQWEPHAWAIFSNHYHIIIQARQDEKSLRRMITALHSKTAISANKMDGAAGRKVWYQYWDTALTNERSYLARMHYVMNNPEKHGVAKSALQYPYGSCQWFCKNAEKSLQRSVFAFPCDNIGIIDEFEVMG